jgi:hypothetical protein
MVYLRLLPGVEAPVEGGIYFVIVPQDYTITPAPAQQPAPPDQTSHQALAGGRLVRRP